MLLHDDFRRVGCSGATWNCVSHPPLHLLHTFIIIIRLFSSLLYFLSSILTNAPFYFIFICYWECVFVTRCRSKFIAVVSPYSSIDLALG